GPGIQTCGLASDLCDAIVVGLWESLLEELPAAAAPVLRRHAALVAHGGYGRRVLAPHSDIDLMLLYERRAAVPVAAAAKRLLQDLFDAGAEVGQSVRTMSDALRLAAADATILSSLLECRPLAGNADLVVRLETRLRKMLGRAPRRYARALVEARREEAGRYGETVSLLEPNVKRSPGGLRDIQLVRWLGRVLWGEASFDGLALAGGVSRRDADTLRDAAEFLTRLRNDMHLSAGKAADALTRDQQLRIAADRGIESCDGQLGVERFMRDYFRHSRGVAQVAETLVAGLRRSTAARSLVAGVLGNRVDGLFRVGPHDVAAASGCLGQVAGSLDSVVRLVELSALYDLPIDHATWEAVRGNADRLPADAAARRRFLGLFARPQRLGDALRRLHEVSALEILIPEFAHARYLLQFNNYHKYTVDEHCIVAVERAAELQDDPGWLGDVWRQLNRKRPLLLALLIHDHGKGFVEDHSELGARMARDIAGRFELPADEAEIVEFLVHKHLAMAHQAFRRNTADDSLVVRFARDVGSPEVLRMLAVLTAADVAAVGPGVWTRWKADLLGDLYFRTLNTLDGESPSVAAERHRRTLDDLLAGRDPADPLVQLARQLPLSYLHDTEPVRMLEELAKLVRLEPQGLFIGTRWQPATGTVAITVATRESVASGIFHRLTGALTSQRLEILAADIHTLDQGLVLDHFIVHDPDYAGEPPAERLGEVADAIRAALRADASPSFTRRWNPFAPLPNPAAIVPARVRFDNESSAHATILEVFAHDSVGLLYAIARAIFEQGLSVRSAKIGTYLDQVVDAFHVTYESGRKVVDPERLATIRQVLERVAAPVTGPGGWERA
ncbi:MAG: [protein-PII] uridylyltransferase, partial [Planctomycetia bacterium]